MLFTTTFIAMILTSAGVTLAAPIGPQVARRDSVLGLVSRQVPNFQGSASEAAQAAQEQLQQAQEQANEAEQTLAELQSGASDSFQSAEQQAANNFG